MINVATVFSGIGAAEQALKQMGVDHKIVFACDNGERYLKQTPEESLLFKKKVTVFRNESHPERSISKR